MLPEIAPMQHLPLPVYGRGLFLVVRFVDSAKEPFGRDHGANFELQCGELSFFIGTWQLPTIARGKRLHLFNGTRRGLPINGIAIR